MLASYTRANSKWTVLCCTLALCLVSTINAETQQHALFFPFPQSNNPLGSNPTTTLSEDEAKTLISTLVHPAAMLSVLSSSLTTESTSMPSESNLLALNNPILSEWATHKFQPFTPSRQLLFVVESAEEIQSSWLSSLSDDKAHLSSPWNSDLYAHLHLITAYGGKNAVWIERGVKTSVDEALTTFSTSQSEPAPAEDAKSFTSSLNVLSDVLSKASFLNAESIPEFIVAKMVLDSKTHLVDGFARIRKLIDAYVLGGSAMVMVVPRTNLADHHSILSVQLTKRQFSALSTSSCPTTAISCKTTFSNCSGHGACVLVPKSKYGNDCYLCKCNKLWAGDSTKSTGKHAPVLWTGPTCQAQDISVSFNILLALTVFLTVTTLAVVRMMGSIADEGAFVQGSFGGNGDGLKME